MAKPPLCARFGVAPIRIAVGVCLALAASQSAGAADSYRIETWTADNGLPVSSVNRVLQTPEGYLWLATYAGLIRYNGSTFQAYNTANSKGLRTSRFTHIFLDREGGLWAPTEGQGVTRYDRGRFTTYTIDDGLLDNNSSDFYYDTEGRLIIDSNKGAVEWRDGRFLRGHLHGPSLADKDKVIQGRTASGATWYTDRGGLHRYEHGRVSRTEPVFLDIKRVFEEASGKLWMEHAKQSGARLLASYEKGKLTHYGPADGVPPFRTLSAAQDRHGTIWLGLMEGGGLLRIRDGRITRLTTADGLASNNVRAVFEDREGTVWVPTEGGLNCLSDKAVTAYTPANGLASENVYPILQDRRGAIWVGTWPGLNKHENGLLSPARTEFPGRENIMSLFEDRDGALWIGTWGWGVKTLRNGRLEPFPTAAGAVVRAILQDRKGDMWFGGPTGLTRSRGGQVSAVTAGDGFRAEQVFSLFESRTGDLWIGTEAGATRYTGGSFTDYGEVNGFPGKFVRSFHEDERGVLWLGTYDLGLFRYERDRFTRYTKEQGLFDNGAFQILDDGRGYLWMTCNAGIYRVLRKDLDDVAAGRLRAVTSTPYGKPDGMPSTECNGGAQPAGIRARDGRLWLPTQKGVAVLDPAALGRNATPPPVVIEAVFVDRQLAPSTGRIEVLPGQSSVEIQYAALTFIRPELTQFKYKIEGLDSDWVDAGNRRAAYFSHLPFGTYRFRVIAANRDRVWNLEGPSLTLRIVPPFWRTLPFAVSTVGGVCALVFLWIRRRLRLLRREQAVHDEFARQLIDSQEKERQRIAAELHDSVSQTLSIIGHRAARSLQGAGPAGAADEQMEEIAAAAGEALAEIREIVHNLRPVEIDRLGLTKALAAMIKKVNGSTPIRISSEIDPVDGVFAGGADIHVYRMVQEGLNNIVRHSGADEAAVRVRREPHAIEITIRDNGAGFSPGAAARSPSSGSGLGLMGISERARIAGGKVAIDSSPGKGALLTIRIPLERPPSGP